MSFIDPHVHMVSRTLADYEQMANAGCVAVCEPAFWAGFDRKSSKAFEEYFLQLTRYEPKRSAQFGIQHYSWICMNPKEAEQLELSREVIKLIPYFLDSPNVIGIGEIGLNKVTRNEITIMEEQLDLAIQQDCPVMVHTPHLEDKLRGTRTILDVLRSHSRVNPERIIIDHIEEHTAQMVLDQGFWGGITLYPFSKVSTHRAVDMVEQLGGDRIMVNSGADWGWSDPLAVPRFQVEMRLRGHSQGLIDRITLQNPKEVLKMSRCQKLKE